MNDEHFADDPSLSEEEEEEEEDDDEEEEEEEEIVLQNDANQKTTHLFDVNISTTHSYLGEVDHVVGLSLHSPGDVISNFPILPISSVVLFPGEILPLKLFSSSETCLNAIKSKIFGVLNVSSQEVTNQNKEIKSSIGTIAEIRSTGQVPKATGTEYRNRHFQRPGGLSIVVRGRQRFRLLEEASQDMEQETFFFGKIEVLPEAPSPLANLLFNTRQMRPNSSVFWSEVGNLLGIPSSVISEYDVDKLGQQALTALNDFTPDLFKKVTPPTESVALSFWLASQIPDDAARQKLLESSTVYERLRLVYKEILKWKEAESSMLRCIVCSAEIASRSGLITMTQQGLVGAYVNPYGIVFETLTLSIDSIKPGTVATKGRASVETSWFPGYAWTIAYCAFCSCHLGWKFDSVTPGLSPTSFWGFRRTALGDSKPQPSNSFTGNYISAGFSSRSR